MCSQSSVLFVKKLSADATSPKKFSDKAAGYDLYSAEDTVIEPGKRFLIHTQIAIKLPPNVYGRIAPRSGMALKNGIDVLAGVIDPDYRGEVGVILFNSDNLLSFTVRKGDRIAQLILEQYLSDVDVKVVDELDVTERNDGGFGSSGGQASLSQGESFALPPNPPTF